MLTVKSLNPDQRLSVTIAIVFAEDVLSAFEKQYPKDMRPRKAIEAAKAWLVSPRKEAAYDAACDSSDAACDADYADYAACDADYAASDAAAAAADAAVMAAYAAAAASDAVNAAADSVNFAVSAAFYAADASISFPHYLVRHSSQPPGEHSLYIHNKLAQLLPHIFEYKVYAKTSFKDSEQVFDLLSEENQQRFLFNLSHLR